MKKESLLKTSHPMKLTTMPHNDFGRTSKKCKTILHNLNNHLPFPSTLPRRRLASCTSTAATQQTSPKNWIS